jgi:transcriptional regulator with XRE-family HTH domain
MSVLLEVAEAAVTTQRFISYYENDDGVPRSSAVIALAKASKVSADELLGSITMPRQSGSGRDFRW